MKTILSPSRFEQSTAIERGKLFSYTAPIDPCDLFVFYQSHRPTSKGQRFYWKNADGTCEIVGVGIALSLTSKSPKRRFAEIQQQWDKLIQEAQIENNYDVAGTGPLLFGGFSFDPQQMPASEWEDFGHALFYLPEIMITCSQEHYFLTINQFDSMDLEGGERVKQWIKKMKSEPLSIPERLAQKEYDIEGWLKSVEESVNKLQTTDMQKVVLARKLQLDFTEPLRSEPIIDQLLSQQPNSYVFSMEAGDSCFLGASPERLIEKMDQQVLSTCLAGSTARGENKQEDKRLGDSLLQDPKNLFEHELVVSMIEDALRPFCEEMLVPKEPILLKTPYIQHLYTPVKGRPKRGCSILEMVQSLHPTPAMGGVPTRSAMNVIRDKENMDRGFYASPIGWTDYQGNGEFIVGIRSGLAKGSSAYLYAGCGIVADSNAEKELVETRIKFQPMLRAFGKESL
ncbi:isochorismate synthase [Bacillus sp. SD088]|uniref:isochorismate synthase n=1 Tax=Bacillus sp. SD088 TaxID=2782012 RepID=UPI001A95D950|nr:isochorismate synthase [Bacillus sp. SD088]MBO0992488.1 isochorismate synthase [Bacillus sp. SD088]